MPLHLPEQFVLFSSSLYPLLQEHTSVVRLVDVLVSRTQNCSQALSSEQFLFGSTIGKEEVNKEQENEKVVVVVEEEEEDKKEEGGKENRKLGEKEEETNFW